MIIEVPSNPSTVDDSMILHIIALPPGYNSHMNNPCACSSSTWIEGNTVHPSLRQCKAKSITVPTTLARQELHHISRGRGR